MPVGELLAGEPDVFEHFEPPEAECVYQTQTMGSCEPFASDGLSVDPKSFRRKHWHLSRFVRLTYAEGVPQEKQEKPNWETIPPRDWAEEQAYRVAQEVRRLRGRKRTAQWVSDRTDELGYRITRAVISDLEVGRRRYVTIAELIVLALALDTAPIALLYPAPYLEKIRTFPKPGDGDPEFTKIWSAQWFSGLTSGLDADGCGNLVQIPLPSAMNVHSNLIALTRARRAQKLDEVRIDRLDALKRMRADQTASAEKIAELVAEIEDLQRDIDELWSLGGRDLAAEQLDRLMNRRGGDSDGG